MIFIINTNKRRKTFLHYLYIIKLTIYSSPVEYVFTIIKTATITPFQPNRKHHTAITKNNIQQQTKKSNIDSCAREAIASGLVAYQVPSVYKTILSPSR